MTMNNPAYPLRELLQLQMAALEKREGKQSDGLPTGLTLLDEMTTGFYRGDLVVVAGRPSMGKTALMLSVAKNMATGGIPVAIFSPEMSRHQLARRLLTSHARVDGHKFRLNLLGREDGLSLQEAYGVLESAPLHINDTPALSLVQIHDLARRLVQEQGVKAIFIDNLQLMGEPDLNAQVVQGLKTIARELDVAMVGLFQLPQHVHTCDDDYQPRMSNFKELDVVQAADLIVLLHREDFYHASNSKRDQAWMDSQTNARRRGMVDIIVAKQRNGPTGTISMLFDGCTHSFMNVVGWEDDAGCVIQPAN